MTSVRITVVRPGFGTTVQDAGRPGFAHLGVPRSGPVDASLAALANRVVGNPPGTALFETAGGLVLRAEGAVLVASTTELAPRVLAAGEELAVAHDPTRNFHYLAIAGGLEVPTVLGSTSHDTLSGLGPDRVVAGTTFRVGAAAIDPPGVDASPIGPVSDRVAVVPGPHLERFAEGAFARFCAMDWRIGDEISRVGARLDHGDDDGDDHGDGGGPGGGPGVRRRDDRELPSEGLVLGAVQISHDGRAVVMLADHPTTGGYPVIAVVVPEAVASVAQLPPRHRVRFVAAP